MIVPGALVTVCAGDERLPARVVETGPGDWALAETADGRRWLEVVCNVSAAYFTRLVLLRADAAAADADAIARAVAWRPRRADVTDVPGAARLCAPGDCLELRAGD